MQNISLTKYWFHLKAFKSSVYTEQAWTQILPVLRLVQQGPEDHVVQEDPGKKADTLNQMLMTRNNIFLRLPNASVELESTEKESQSFPVI